MPPFAHKFPTQIVNTGWKTEVSPSLSSTLESSSMGIRSSHDSHHLRLKTKNEVFFINCHLLIPKKKMWPFKTNMGLEFVLQNQLKCKSLIEKVNCLAAFTYRSTKNVKNCNVFVNSLYCNLQKNTTTFLFFRILICSYQEKKQEHKKSPQLNIGQDSPFAFRAIPQKLMELSK